MIRVPRRVGRDAQLTFFEHLDELRARILIVAASVLVATAGMYVIHSHLLDWLDRPLPAGHRRLAGLGVAEPFTVTLTVCVYAGVALALPVALWQLWSFLVPAVDPPSERAVVTLVAAAFGLGASGAAFAYGVVLPRAVGWLVNFDSRHFTHIVQAKPYYTFVITIVLGMIIVFELPLVVFGLVTLGVVSADTLRTNRRLGYFIVAVIALGLPGPDLYTTLLELLPMWALFEGSIWLAVLVQRRQTPIAQTF